MKVGFDIDGTLTKFDQFVKTEGQKYMVKNYGFGIQNHEGYDLDEVFELKKKFAEGGLGGKDAEIKARKVLSDFWNKYYLKYIFGYRLQKGVSKFIKKIKEEGHEVHFYTSRRKATELSPLGKFVRTTIKLQLLLGGIKYNKVNFYENDEEKIKALLDANLDLFFDDKKELLETIKKDINVVCVDNPYNKEYKGERITDYCNSRSLLLKNKIIKRNPQLEKVKLNEKISHTEKVYKLVRFSGKHFVYKKFNPKIINQDVLPNEKEPIIYAPNHRSTLDPFFLVSTIKDPIHWAALKRFFDGEDSIFNNSKNIFLRKLTVAMFNGIGAVPIDRENPFNMKSTRELNDYLANDTSIGVFPEGTTNKNPEEKDLGEIHQGIFALAKRNNAWIQPIAIVWAPKDIEVENKVVINFLDPFKVEDMKRDEAAAKYEEILLEGIQKNKEIISDMIKEKENTKETNEEEPKVKVRRI